MPSASPRNALRAPDAGRKGRVILVGTGPGDPDLITCAGLEALRTADVVIYDRLAPPELLEEAPPDAQRIDAGKCPGRPGLSQEEICRRLVDYARRGATVVRLKGGDPSIFGRSGEELAAVSDAGIDFQVIPGVPAACGAAAYAGIPLTRRGEASAVAFVTGHRAADAADDTNWAAVAAFPGTLVVHMGVSRLEQVVSALRAGGRPAREPAAMVERATTGRQRMVTAPLEGIVRAARNAGIRAPALLITGPTVKHSPRFAEFARRPLYGQRVVVTRPAERAAPTVRALRRLGADVHAVPVIQIVPIPLDAPGKGVFEQLGRFDDLVLTSAAGVTLFFRHLRMLGRDARALAGVRVAAIGPATAARLEEHGIRADLVPSRYVAESLLAELQGRAPANLKGRRVLLARATNARPFLARKLREAGARVVNLPLYRTIPAPEIRDRLAAVLAQGPVWMTFTSPSCVDAVCDALDGAETAFRGHIRALSIGPVTTRRLRERGLPPKAEAEPHTGDGLVAAFVRAVRTA